MTHSDAEPFEPLLAIEYLWPVSDEAIDADIFGARDMPEIPGDGVEPWSRVAA
jgi:hypothetical protein